MRERRWWFWIALALSLAAPAARAQVFEDQRFNVTGVVGRTFLDQELEAAPEPMLSDHAYWGGRLSMRLASYYWLELASGYTAVLPDGGGSWTHNSLNFMVQGHAWRSMSPFASLGAGIAQYRPVGIVSSDEHNGNAEAAGGVKVRLTDAFGLRLEARDMLLVPKEDWGKAHIDNVVLGLGLVYGFGGPPRDSDGDGVPDGKDQCAATPHGCVVDATGCPVDSDHDGVCDGPDLCPNTPAGATVNAGGCPQDSDGDGAFDGRDRCPNTPRGATVDGYGCPTDADGDGVFDGLDACPDTPKGCTLDARGCPIDSDGDGVCDGLDRCANTPPGTQVDGRGCPVFDATARETELIERGRIRLSNLNFDTGASGVSPADYAVLDTVGRVLAKWPGLMVEVAGHTDPRGSETSNRDLSRRRAVSVRAYLLAHFPQLKPDQLTAKGYGGTKPIVPNTSPANMARNRRVEFEVLNPQVLQHRP